MAAAYGVAPAKNQDSELDPNLQAARQDVQAGIRRGANWFYWIAALSTVNSVMALAGSNARFIVGLGITEMGSAVAGLIVNVFAASAFIALGVYANKYQKWAFLAGMALYVVDAVVLVMLQQWLSVAFHGVVLYCLWNGYGRLGENEELTRRFQLHAV